MQDHLSQCPWMYFTVEDAVVVYFWDCRRYVYLKSTFKGRGHGKIAAVGRWVDVYVCIMEVPTFATVQHTIVI